MKGYVKVRGTAFSGASFRVPLCKNKCFVSSPVKYKVFLKGLPLREENGVPDRRAVAKGR